MKRKTCQHCGCEFQPERKDYWIDIDYKGDIHIMLKCRNKDCGEDIEFQIARNDEWVEV